MDELAIVVGIERELGEDKAREYYLPTLDDISLELEERYGISWWEPDPVELPGNRARRRSFGVRVLHYLRRAAAMVRAGEPVTPMPRGESEDDELEDEDSYGQPSSHLLNHSDCDGFYLPIEFAEPIGFGYELVGSTQRLLAELLECAPALGIVCEADGSLSDEEAERLAFTAFRSPFQFEWTAWLALHEACLQSIATGHAIVFVFR